MTNKENINLSNSQKETILIISRKEMRDNYAVKLAERLMAETPYHVKVIYPTTSLYFLNKCMKETDLGWHGIGLVINYGCSSYIRDGISAFLSHIPSLYYLNSFETIRNSVDKLKSFALVKELPTIPIFTTEEEVLQAIQESPDKPILARELMTAGQGRGICVLEDEQAVRSYLDTSRAKFYTQAIPGREFRVIILNDKVVTVTMKKRYSSSRREENNIEDNIYTRTIRSHRNGWLFSVNPESKDLQKLESFALDCAEKLTLKWGAIDIIEDPNGSLYFLESNTAIGLRSETVISKVVDSISSLMKSFN